MTNVPYPTRLSLSSTFLEHRARWRKRFLSAILLAGALNEDQRNGYLPVLCIHVLKSWRDVFTSSGPDVRLTAKASPLERSVSQKAKRRADYFTSHGYTG